MSPQGVTSSMPSRGAPGRLGKRTSRASSAVLSAAGRSASSTWISSTRNERYSIGIDQEGPGGTAFIRFPSVGAATRER
jgi:hypothetical protein